MFFKKSLEPSGHLVDQIVQSADHALRDTSRQLRDQAQRASDNAVSYIKEEPGKAMLIAAATTAALLVLVSLLRHPRGRR